jgi:hypothetical protein
MGYTGSASTVIGYTGSASTIIGYTGSQGIIGLTGSASTVVGYTGSLGYTGSIGFTGSQSTIAGYTGSIGYTGSDGTGIHVSDTPPPVPFLNQIWADTTENVSYGPIGFTGSQGPIGYTGSRSTVVGYTGSLGYTGSQGSGFTGSAGYTGSIGAFAGMRVSSSTSITSPVAFSANSYDMYCATAQAVALTINNPTGSPINGQRLIFRIKDNGSAKALTWSGTYFRQLGASLPPTTVAGKVTYVGLIYNAAETKWDCISVAQEV